MIIVFFFLFNALDPRRKVKLVKSPFILVGM